jgi:hypothetical protein
VFEEFAVPHVAKKSTVLETVELKLDETAGEVAGIRETPEVLVIPIISPVNIALPVVPIARQVMSILTLKV